MPTARRRGRRTCAPAHLGEIRSQSVQVAAVGSGGIIALGGLQHAGDGDEPRIIHDAAERLVTEGAFADAGVTGIPIEMLLLGQVINIVLASWLINLLPALGEEIGWRGWLTPQLLPLGVVPTILITGVIWGLWHTPLILLGHNYPHLPGWLAVIFMVIFCTLVGGVLAWLSIRTNSVWPAALGHSTINATAALPLLFSADASYDPAHVGITGTIGWSITAVRLAIFILTRSFRPPRPVEVDSATAWPSDFPASAPDQI